MSDPNYKEMSKEQLLEVITTQNATSKERSERETLFQDQFKTQLDHELEGISEWIKEEFVADNYKDDAFAGLSDLRSLKNIEAKVLRAGKKDDDPTSKGSQISGGTGFLRKDDSRQSTIAFMNKIRKRSQ